MKKIYWKIHRYFWRRREQKRFERSRDFWTEKLKNKEN